MKILVLDVGGTAIKSALIDEADQLYDIRLSTSSSEPEERIQKVISLAKAYSEFDAVSCAMCGQIDDQKGEVLFRYHRSSSDQQAAFPAGKILQAALGCPVFLLNDCNAAALGEAYFGAGEKENRFLCLTYGTGVGGAIIENRELYSGSCGIAGEVGHMITHKGGRPCGCGGRGCYEQYASTTALLRNAKKHYPHLENAKQLFALAQEEAALQKIIRAWEGEIVTGLLTLSYIFNPSCIILGGGVMERTDVIEQIRRQFAQSVIPTFGDLQILPARLGNQAGLFGAAVYARQRLSQS